MELFKIFGKIAIDNEEANENLESTSKKAGSFAETLKKGAGVAAKFGTAVVTGTAAAGAALVGVASSSASTANEIDKMSQRIGFSIESYQEWEYIASKCGTSMETLQGGITDFAEKMDDAASGTGEAAEIFDRLGISVLDSEGNLRSQHEVFEETIVALQEMENATERQALATKLMSTTGEELLPLLNGQVGGIDELKKSAHDLGIVMSDEAVAAGVELSNTFDDVKKSAGAVGSKIGVALFPIIQKVLDMVLKFMPQVQNIFDSLSPVLIGLMDSLMPLLFSLAENVFPMLVDLLNALLPSFIQITEAILPVLVQVIQLLLPPLIQLVKAVLPVISTLLSAVMKILSPILDLLSPLLSAIMAILSPLLELLNVILQPLIDLFTFLAETIGSVLGPVFEGIGTVLGKVGEGFTWLKEKASGAMSDMKAKIEENGGGIKGYFKTMTDSAKQAWGMAFDKMDEITGGKMSAMKQKIEENGGGIKGVFKTVTDTTKKAWSTAFDKMNDITGGKLGEIKDKMTEKLTAAKDAVVGIFEKIKSGITEKIEMAKNVISGIIDKIKGIFNFDFKLPKIKMPHFSISPSGWEFGDLLEGSIPKLGIEWYAKGGVMEKPTLFGRNGNNAMVGGEAGAEAIAPISTLQTYIREAVAEQNVSNYSMMREAFTDALREVLPDMQEVVKVVPDESGIFRVVRDKAREYTQKTGNPSFA